MIKQIKNDLQKLSDKNRARQCLRFFKTGPGEYGEGDNFIGVSVPEQRIIAKRHIDIGLDELQQLISSPIHEYRQTSFFILVYKYQKAKDIKEKTAVFNFYIKNRRLANNWDLVDLSAPSVVGQYMLEWPAKKKLLYTYAKSKNLWERRISIVATYAFIRTHHFNDTLKISRILLHDSHDLIQKAVGWMLREVGNRDRVVEEKFLQGCYQKMPRTMLRYAIEKFPQSKRKYYMKK